MTVLNLFRGQCIGVKVDTKSDDSLITLDLEDYNRLPPILPLGAPNGDVTLDQADGTSIAVDGRGVYTSYVSLFAAFTDGGCWPDDSPVLDLVTGFLSDDVPGSPGIDNQTALSSLKAHADELAPRISGALRWWIAPPPSGDGLVLYVVDYLDPVQVALLPAPYAIDADTPNWTTSLLPIKLGPFSWDWAGIRGSTYVRGGTPVPEGSGFATGLGNAPTGTAYIDAPGSITDDDKTVIGAWHQNRSLVELLTASATMPGSLFETTFGGWRVGQTVAVTSARHSRITDHAISARDCVIQKVTGRLVTPAGGLGIKIAGTSLTKPFEWKSLTFESVLDSAGKATVVIHLLSDTDTLAIPKNADVWITLDDTAPADIEWDLEFGDIPAGGLSQELAKAEEKPAPAPVYRFWVEIADPAVPVGESSQVTAQLCDGAKRPIALAGVPMEWVILANDEGGSPLDTTGWLADDVGTSDSAGRVFTTYTPGTGAAAVEIDALALPIV